jgi:SOS response regulatory protein OraA/RecX
MSSTSEKRKHPYLAIMETKHPDLLMKKAGALLARRAYTRSELRDRLAKTSGKASVEKVLDRLEQLNLLNDADYSYNFALCRIRQGWSHARVKESLLRRHIDRNNVEGALQRIGNELDDQSAAASYLRTYCKKKGLPADLKGLRKLVTHLRQRGYEEDSISGALCQVIPAALLQRFETGE